MDTSSIISTPLNGKSLTSLCSSVRGTVLSWSHPALGARVARKVTIILDPKGLDRERER
jgi:hypothetical protein